MDLPLAHSLVDVFAFFWRSTVSTSRVQIRGAAADAVNVKRLPKRPAPPRFGRKLTAAQKARATHICLDWCAPVSETRSLRSEHRCRSHHPLSESSSKPETNLTSMSSFALHLCSGFIYFLNAPFEEQPTDFECPQCNAPKKRFSKYDAETGKIIGGGALPQIVNIAGLIGIAGAVALVGLGLLS